MMDMLIQNLIIRSCNLVHLEFLDDEGAIVNFLKGAHIDRVSFTSLSRLFDPVWVQIISLPNVIVVGSYMTVTSGMSKVYMHVIAGSVLPALLNVLIVVD